YPFPGNVRELQHAVEHALVLARGTEIDLDQLPADIRGMARAPAPAGAAAAEGVRPLAMAAREFEREYLLRALGQAGGRKARAAELLGISRKNLWEKLRSHGISDSDLED
ncbi:MAG: helix-turn-helix domain-containing protein, partial [Myxococcales bacterium]